MTVTSLDTLQEYGKHFLLASHPMHKLLKFVQLLVINFSNVISPTWILALASLLIVS